MERVPTAGVLTPDTWPEFEPLEDILYDQGRAPVPILAAFGGAHPPPLRLARPFVRRGARIEGHAHVFEHQRIGDLVRMFQVQC